MNVTVRYFSKSGRTAQIAEAVAKGAEATVASITEQGTLDKKYDILFIGGAPYANIMAPELRKYVEQLEADKVGVVALFTTSNWSRRTITTIKLMLKSKGIKVAKETFYANASQIDGKIEEAEKFGAEIISKYAK